MFRIKIFHPLAPVGLFFIFPDFPIPRIKRAVCMGTDYAYLAMIDNSHPYQEGGKDDRQERMDKPEGPRPGNSKEGSYYSNENPLSLC